MSYLSGPSGKLWADFLLLRTWSTHRLNTQITTIPQKYQRNGIFFNKGKKLKRLGISTNELTQVNYSNGLSSKPTKAHLAPKYINADITW